MSLAPTDALRTISSHHFPFDLATSDGAGRGTFFQIELIWTALRHDWGDAPHLKCEAR